MPSDPHDAADRSVSPTLSRGKQHSSRRPPTGTSVTCWVIIVPLGIVALLRVVAWDDFQPFALLNTVTAFVYLPAWMVLIVALICRRAFLAGAALAIVLAQVVFLYPELSAAEPIPGWAATAPVLRMLDANVSSENPSMAGYASQIAKERPELLTMEEVSPTDVAQLERDGALADLPYRIEIKRYDSGGFFIGSQFPLVGANVVYYSAGLPLIVETTIRLPSGPLPLWVVHAVAPLPVSFSDWRGELKLIGQLVRSHGTAGLLVVGDFNSTWGNQGFRNILAAPLSDGAAARGRAFDMTWSQVQPIVPPLVRIDHVLSGAGLVVTTVTTGEGHGSDHKDLMAIVAIHPDRPART